MWKDAEEGECMRGLDACQECVFCSDGYADVDLGINLYCTHPSYAKCVGQCPTVLSYTILKRMRDAELETCPSCGKIVITGREGRKYCASCGWKVVE